jgi:aspartyl/glutamyl-tRNA(Asn/Gln) amidotransferase C subunit
MNDQELAELAKDFDPILAYVGQIQEVKIEPTSGSSLVKNVFREDVVKNAPNQYTDKILEQMPDSLDGYLKVKQIL